MIGGSFAACGGSDSGITTGDDGGAETGTPPPPPASDDGGAITDGGSNFDPDAGDDDAGLPDGGKCNAVDNTATAITSTCRSTTPSLAGGALVSGTYHLAEVADLGTQAFCKSTFVPTGFKETLLLTVSGTTATAETVTLAGVGGVGGRRATATFTTTASSTSPLSATETCPNAGAPAAIPYASGPGNGGVQTLEMILPYGKGVALYRFEKAP